MADALKGKVDFRNDDSADIKVIIGKINFEDQKLVDNLK